MPASDASATEISPHATNSKVNAVHVPAKESVMKPSRACKNCGGYSNEEQDGGVVCTSCGMILDGSVLVNTHDQGLTHVNALGRDRNANRRQLAQIAFGGVGQGPEAARVARFHRTLEVESLLRTIAFSVGLVENDVKRALYLWGHLPVPMPSGKERRVTRRALACLYLCSKESKKGVTLAEIAMRLSIHPYKLGADYKMIKAELADKGVIDYSHPCFNTEDDVWILSDRIMTIGSEDSIQRGDPDQLTPDLKEAFGINAEDRASRLRRIWTSSHKCLKIAIDAGLATGRRAQAVVAACLIVAVEIQLQLTESPQCLVDFVCRLFNTPEHTVTARYRELRNCMLSWARRLPFIPKSKKITGSRLVYYLEDVLQHFGHLDELNKSLWEILDNPKSDDSDSEDGADQYEHDVERHENDEMAEQVPITSSSLPDGDPGSKESSFEKVGESGDLSVKSVSPHDKSREVTANDGPLRPIYPPSFVANQKRRHNQANLIMIAKQQLPSDKTRHHDKRRVHWIKCLLKQGSRTEQEIISASDADLARWYTHYEMEASGVTRPKPSQQELDSCELSERDLPEEELVLYLRNEEERKTLWRVIAPDFLESERRAKEYKEKRAAAQERKSRRKRQTLRQSTTDQHERKKVRSSKLCWDALSDSEDTGMKNDAVQSTTPDPSPEDIVGDVVDGGYVDPIYHQSSYVVNHDYGYGYGYEYDHEEEEGNDYGQDY